MLTDSLAASSPGRPIRPRLFFTIEDRGRQAVNCSLPPAGRNASLVDGASSLDDMQLTADGKTMIYTGPERFEPDRDLHGFFGRRPSGTAHPSERRALAPPR